ncbi:MAG TPA: thermonuclease family protein [Gemmatimonadales bacterium]|nr:thermonuclease family protein [Gemmatimonadales bacterium]
MSRYRLQFAPVIAFLFLAPPALVAQPTPDSVWVNFRSGVYHCPGTRDFGVTSRGEYLSEAAARARGFRANGGRSCTSAAVPDSGPAIPADSLEDCVVTRVLDGDSIHCAAQGSVRLIGLDAPEQNQEPFGSEATAAARAMLPIGAVLRLKRGVNPRDRYGRLLAYAWYDGLSFNWLMIRQGWAVSYRYDNKTLWADRFAAAEERARAEQLGLWRKNGFACRPVDRRAGRC